MDVTLSELTIETFYPLDLETATIIRQMAAESSPRTCAELMAAAPAPERYGVGTR